MPFPISWPRCFAAADTALPRSRPEAYSACAAMRTVAPWTFLSFAMTGWYWAAKRLVRTWAVAVGVWLLMRLDGLLHRIASALRPA